ncbi:hypothetical protein [Candidatus Venteria ishoeyi]|uniref:Uncharacterized protein n=1 Tax=Candidatus Venteria ishoeyi TaxID=1899563 RepID=A0A1H6FBG3_9GAMM|nr:hypothetical protein [Candidatus Venteria ishoeyi]SEH07432.1 Uncharacterised protein [Candidatus Venteria ishoeyi]
MVARQIDSVDLKVLKAKFTEEVPKKIAAQAQQGLQEKRLARAENILKAYELFPSALQNPQGRKLIRDMQQKILARRDENQYNLLRKAPDPGNVQEYLQNAPLKTMREAVQAYKNYYESIRPDAQLDLTLVLVRIDWQNVSDNGNEINVYVNGVRKVQRTEIDAVSQQSTLLNAKIPQKVHADGALKVRVTITDKGMVYDEDNGQGTFEKEVKAFAKKPMYELFLKQQENNQATAKVIFRLEGYPQAPKLPAWRNVQ